MTTPANSAAASGQGNGSAGTPRQTAGGEPVIERVVIVAQMARSELLSRLRELTLLGREARPYAQAALSVVQIPADMLVPVSRYVAASHLERQRQLRSALLREGIDTLRLDGAVSFQVATDSGVEPSVWTIMPPVVELQRERMTLAALRAGDLPGPEVTVELPIINDGLHRVYMARELGLPVQAVVVSGAAAEYPYYAYPAGWSAVQVVEAVPRDKAARKTHRCDDHYSLFRDFGPLGVGRPRHPDEVRP